MTWSTYRTDAGGRPALALLDRRFEIAPPTDQLPRLAWFGVWCRLPPNGGLWDAAEGETLEAIERALIELAGQHARGWAVYVRHLATPGVREYYLYAGRHVELAPVLAELQARFPSYRIEYEHRDDPEWELYRQWLAERGAPVGEAG